MLAVRTELRVGGGLFIRCCASPCAMLQRQYGDAGSDEQYLISWAKSSAVSTNPYALGYVAAGVMMCAVAAYYESIPFMVVAFIVVCGFRLWEEWYQAKWARLWGAIVTKYEAAALGSENEAKAVSRPEGRST